MNTNSLEAYAINKNKIKINFRKLQFQIEHF